MKREYENSEIAYWTCDDSAETLTYTDIDEAIYDYLESDPTTSTEKLTVYGHVRDEVPESRFEVLDELIENLDGDFGSCFENEPTEKTPAMIEAENAFIAVMKKEYKPWTCRCVKEVEIDVEEWIEKNKPQWIAGPRP